MNTPCQRLSILGAAMLLALVAPAKRAAAQLCVQLNGATYRQDFNLLPQSGTSNISSTLPIGFAYAESGTGNNVTYAADNGSLATSNTYSYGSVGNSDRALGELTGPLTSIIGACFVNNTGFVIPSISIAYTGEQWRLGVADAVLDRLDFQFSTNALSLNDEGEPGRPVTWTDVNTLDFVSPIPINTGTAGAKDGNAAANRHTFTPTAIIPASGIPFSATFFIRWLPSTISGANDGLAIDDFTITYAPSADFDQDQDVDGKDFIALQRGLGTKSGGSISNGDANKDGAIDGLDLFLWRDQFGTTRDAPPITSVPEPTGACLLALAIAGLATTRRRC